MSVEDAMSQALGWMDDAQNSSSLDASEKAFALKVKTTLIESRVLPSPDIHNMECDKSNGGFVAAYVSNEENSPIFVCESGFEFGSEFLAQVFVHEAIHLSGILDECQTTVLEQKLISAGGGNPFKNSYFEACGLSSDDDE